MPARRAEHVIVDEMNDLALIRLDQSFGGLELVFGEVCPILGEFSVTIGYRLSDLLGSGPQVFAGPRLGVAGSGRRFSANPNFRTDATRIERGAGVRFIRLADRRCDRNSCQRTECQFCD